MQTVTLNQIIALFRDIAERNMMLNDFGNGPTFNIGASRQMKFPYLWVENVNSELIRSTNGYREKVYNFSIFCMDKINMGDDNYDEIISDTNFILDAVVQELQMDPFYTANKISIVYEDLEEIPVIEETDDNVNGWQLNIGIKVPLFYTSCNLPITPKSE